MPANSAVGQATEKNPTSEPAPQHRLRAQAVGLAHDDGEQRRGHVGAGVEQPRAMPHQRRPFHFRADHDARTVDQAQHRNVERVAQMQEPRALVGAVGIDRARQMMRIVGDQPHRPALDADERGDDPDAEFFPDLQHRTLVGDRLDDLAHVVQPQPVFRHDVPQPALVVRLPCRDRPLEVRQIFLRRIDRGEFVLHQDIDDAIGHLERHRADFLGRVDAQAAAFDHRGAAHADASSPRWR